MLRSQIKIRMINCMMVVVLLLSNINLSSKKWETASAMRRLDSSITIFSKTSPSSLPSKYTSL